MKIVGATSKLRPFVVEAKTRMFMCSRHLPLDICLVHVGFKHENSGASRPFVDICVEIVQ